MEQENKLNLQEVRNFSDSMTATFVFIKQEFKPLIIAFAAIVLPMLLIGQYLQGYMASDAALGESYTDISLKWIIKENIMNCVLSFWLMLFTLSYLRVYADKFQKAESLKITIPEIWKEILRHLGKAVVVGIIYLLAVGLGFVFMGIPGIYIGVILMFSLYALIIRDKDIIESFIMSVELCKGKWWYLFGYCLLFILIVTMLSYLFLLPVMVVALVNAFSGQMPEGVGMTLLTTLALVGQYVMMIILAVGIGIQFFSILEKREHTNLLDKIEQIGADAQTMKSEEI